MKIEDLLKYEDFAGQIEHTLSSYLSEWTGRKTVVEWRALKGFDSARWANDPSLFLCQPALNLIARADAAPAIVESTQREYREHPNPRRALLQRRYVDAAFSNCGRRVFARYALRITPSPPDSDRRFYFDFRFGTRLSPLLRPDLTRRVLCVRSGRAE